MVQGISMKSSDQSRKEQQIQKFPDGDIVLSKTVKCNQWQGANVVVVNADDMGSVQSLLASYRDIAGEQVLERPIQRIVLIKEVEV